MPLPALIRRFLVRDDAPAPVAGRAVLRAKFEALRAIVDRAGWNGDDAKCGCNPPATTPKPDIQPAGQNPRVVTASPSARPVPLETRQRLVRFRGYLREHMGEHR